MRRTLERYSLLRDVLGALLVVGLVVGGLAAATGGIWPPVLAIESGSMMHPHFETPYGRIGTIDVGDLIFVRAIDGPEDVALWVDGGEERYGRPGDVVAYLQDGDQGEENLTIIHRAITYVEVTRGPDGFFHYRMPWLDGRVLEFGPAGIYLPALGFDETNGFTPQNGYRPEHSGFLTKGDNPVTNPSVDQAIGLSRIVHPTWIVGEVYGEVPWVGLAPLALRNGQTNPAVPGWERIGNAFAPVELWSMFFLVLGALVLLPFAWGTWRMWRDHRRETRALRDTEREREREGAREARTRPPPKEPVVFEAVSR